MKTTQVINSMALAVLMLAGCNSPENKTEQQVSPEEALKIKNAVMTWMECEECDTDELRNVVALGDVVVPTLAKILEGGPSAAKREELDAHLKNTFDELLRYQVNHPEAKISMSRENYVETYMANYVALYKSRAAMALGQFKSAEAKSALESALKNTSLRADVVEKINQVLKEMK